jgi:hypothetical protein
MGLYDKFEVGGEFVSKTDPDKDEYGQYLYITFRDLHNDLVDIGLALSYQNSDQAAAVAQVIAELADLTCNYDDFAPTEFSDHDEDDEDIDLIGKDG